MDFIIDAKGKRLGRLASEIAVILQGKHTPAYHPRLEGSDRVVVKNIRTLTVGGRKTKTKIYYRHTGPLGHLKENKFRDVFEKKPAWVLRHAVRLMLPKNKLQARRLKRLIIE
ncbi:50S ribosomal protein L13 [Candidatus Jorgensenbacteria bacterium CG10_big_fil_rev_8_21_14_0_10_54_38]|uniref:Large ribosomal subunit protein uL13 n=2 Tax=Candidatus Joergenseniibacteriota TaxID=1752739 RepID=A0A2M6WGF2_9BACT|nr:MAG: 50S ribosomal protein L13 [Candidatus Jorgensenbacteria bacterium CG23_combo_of_CG06-09_8_20_14_all_54_14]PIT91890.1 MAG: 50S ribosomal protein L13 [Candidatus Jorgensenbacteria bacterium CG10_big_fil_rev_8_21_14_0_10_54_38]